MNADFDGDDSRWQVVEDGFDPALANTYETLFTTGNGYLGTRGSLEESHEARCRGPFCAVSSTTTTPRSPTWKAPTGLR